jgi:hypothetical protein
MPTRETGKAGRGNVKAEDPQAARERELRDMIERVESKKAGDASPSNESPNDFVERKMREKGKKGKGA